MGTRSPGRLTPPAPVAGPEAAARTGDLLRRIFENANVGIVAAGIDGRLEFVNEALCRFLGYGRGELLRLTIRDVTFSDDWEESRRHLARMLQGKIPSFSLEKRYRRKDGSTFWGLADVSVLLDQEGRPRGTAAAIQDISASKAAAEALRRSEEQYRLLFELNPNPMWVFDESTLRFLAVNIAAVRLYGYSQREFLLKTIRDVRPPGEVPSLLKALRRQRGLRAAFAGVWRHRRKDGSEFDAEVTISSILFQGHPARLCMVNDLTEQRRAEEAIRQSEVRLRMALEGGHMGLWDWDLDAGHFILSRREFQLLGLPKGKNPIGAIPILRNVHPDDLDGLRRRTSAALRDGTPFHHEFRILHPNGKVRWLAGRGRIFPREGSRRGHMIGVNYDITESKRLDVLRAELNVRLERSVAERTQALRASNRELRQEIDRRRHLERQVLEISEREQRRIGRDLHDGLGQQLSALVYLSSSLDGKQTGRERGRSKDVSRIRSLLANALQEVRSLARGLHPVQPVAEGLMSALQEQAATTRKLFNIACRFVCPRPVLLGDHQAGINLFRIAQEAITNAVRHGRPKRIRIGLTMDRGAVRLTVRDDGAGIPRRIRPGKGLGIGIMEYRASVIGAGFRIRRGTHGGTLVECILPLEVQENGGHGEGVTPGRSPAGGKGIGLRPTPD